MIALNQITKGLFNTFSCLAMVSLVSSALAEEGTWQSKAPMPMAIEGGFVGVIDGQFYAVGGNGTYLQSKNELYDPWTNSWVYKTPPSSLRAYAAGGVIGGKLYLAGGCIDLDCLIGTTNLLGAYDAATDTWSTLAPMPTARSGAAAGVIADKLYVVGGNGACPPCTPQYETLEVYDPSTDSWATKQPMSTPREQPSAAVIGGKLYVAGGAVRTPSYEMTNIVEVYDPATDSWSTAAPMPTARHGAASIAINGKMHVVGGNDLVAPLTTHEVYDPAANIWVTEVPMPTARTFTQAGAVGPTFYVVGGSAGSVGSVTANEAFTVCGNALLCVGIDIQPGSPVNAINPKGKGQVMVAILSTADFDAVTVDTNTVHFGGAYAVNATIRDVNDDGRPDIALLFNTRDVGIACGDKSATLKGSTTEGLSFQGSDFIKTIGCK